LRNPFSEAFQFLFSTTVHGRWPIYFFIVLAIASILIAIYNLKHDASQRTASHVYFWIARFFIGALWFQQSLWKMPPTFTDKPDGVSGGLRYWMTEMSQYAALGVQRSFVTNTVLPHFKFFGYQVWAVETFIAISLMLGLFTRLGGLLGAAMAFNLWLGLYSAPNEWPWTYFILVLLMCFFIFTKAGRALGLDASIAARAEASNDKRRGLIMRAVGHFS
jgi:thiosulfate dehydrogenase (quinone) large subunit